MFDGAIVLLAGLSWGGAVVAGILAVAALLYMIEDGERAYMDSPPKFMMMVWPLVRVVAYFLGSNLPASYLDSTDAKLQKNGVSFMLTAEEFFSVCLVFALLFPALGALALSSSGEVDPAILILLALLGLVIPELWMKDAKTRRDIEIIATLPVYLEYLTMCVDAGLNFSGALKQAVEKGPKGAMKNEFRIVLRDINSGQTRADALGRLEQRVNITDVSVFVSAVVQAEKMGSSMRETLLIQARQRLDERFQRAEKMAMEAPVKLVIPLVVFIFPLTFIILLFPIVVKFMDQGAL